ncbi:MAG: P-loop NTPase [Burkholderiales bacterium]|nr:P-loop NTPase [Burkholderiales bacterium]
MAEFATDQAEGLRRLFGRDFVRIVTLTSSKAGLGKTTAILNLAAALAKAGKNVMVLDENSGRGNLGSMIGARHAHDLLDVVRQGKSLEEVMIAGPQGISILQAAQADLSMDEEERLVDCMSHVARPADVVLVDTAAGSPGHLLSLSAQEIVVVLSPEGSSITDAYALIKMMNMHYAKRHFRILVTRAKNAEEARAVFDNMSRVARRYLAISLDFMGHVPLDAQLRQASRLKLPVVEAFPLSASSSSFRHIADSIVRWPCPAHDEMSLGDFFQHLIQGSRLCAARA